MTASGGLNYLRCGLGVPPLVFVHGFGCALDDWRPAMGLLSGHHVCIALDLPGHGLSAHKPPGSISGCAAAVNDLIQAQGLSGVVLVGHSLGTKVIRECYRQSPKLFAGMVLVDGSTYVGDADVLERRLRANIAKAGLQVFMENQFRQMFVSDSEPAMVERLVRRAMQMGPALATDLLIDSIRWEIAHGDDTLRSLTFPVLLLQSTFFTLGVGRSFMSPAVETPFMKKIAQLVPKFETVVLSDTGHFPMLEQPAGFAALLTRFVSAL